MVPELTQDRLKEILEYDPLTGFFRWIGGRKNKSGDFRGLWRRRAGAKSYKGYVIIEIDGTAYAAHAPRMVVCLWRGFE